MHLSCSLAQAREFRSTPGVCAQVGKVLACDCTPTFRASLFDSVLLKTKHASIRSIERMKKKYASMQEHTSRNSPSVLCSATERHSRRMLTLCSCCSHSLIVAASPNFGSPRNSLQSRQTGMTACKYLVVMLNVCASLTWNALDDLWEQPFAPLANLVHEWARAYFCFCFIIQS